MNGLTCIYCARTDLTNEHYLPRCLGNFAGYEGLKQRLCKECNAKCGKLEGQLCRSSVEAFFRSYLGLRGRTKHKDKTCPFYRGSYGGDRVSVRGDSETAGRGIELELSERGAAVLRHIKFVAEDDSVHVISIPADMKEPSQLRKAFDKLGIKKAKHAFVCAPPEDLPLVKHLLTGLKHEGEARWTVESGPTTFRNIKISFSVTDRYFRCLAKIAFHHFLQKFPAFRGSEDCFAQIRDFVINDGDFGRCNDFIRMTPPMLARAFLQGYSPKVWGHLVTAHVDYHWLSAGVQLFAAPENLAPVYLIKLGRNPSRIVSPQQHEGSFFAIFPKAERGDYDGEVVDAKPAAALLYGLLSRFPLPPPIQLR